MDTRTGEEIVRIVEAATLRTQLKGAIEERDAALELLDAWRVLTLKTDSHIFPMKAHLMKITEAMLTSTGKVKAPVRSKPDTGGQIIEPVAVTEGWKAD